MSLPRFIATPLAGLAAATVITLVNEVMKTKRADAPRLDELGERAVEQPLAKFGVQLSDGQTKAVALVGDIVANTAYYGAAVSGAHRSLLRGAAAGLLGGITAVALPGPLGLGKQPTGRTPETKLMTVGYYVLGGVVASLVNQVLRPK